MSDCNGFIDACTKRQQERCSHGRNNDVGRCIACVIDEAMEQLGEQEIERLERELNEARADLEQCRVQLAGCGVIAGCNTRSTLAEQMPTPDAYGYSASLLDVAKAVTREMNERERAERAEAKLTECMAHADALADTYYKADSHIVRDYREWRAKQ